MGVGPIVTFDKSTLESLSVDESVWFDTLYYPNITPLFFVETLADLELEVSRSGRTPEEIVGNLAEKTPTGGVPNVYHESICAGEIMGHAVEMHQHVPVIGGGEPVETGSQRAIVFKQPAEVEALHRWEDGRFLDVERDFARRWRKGLSEIDLEALYRQGKDIIARLHRPRDLAEAKAMAVSVLAKPGSRYVREGLGSFHLPEGLRREMIGRWDSQGSPPIHAFAPFTAHVLTVDVFFCIALGADLISRQRPSNKIDMAYLYYLPFCMGFTSSDKLHARTSPLFLDADQVFIPGADLKNDLARLDEHYSALPDEVKERGVMSFAHYPPTEGDFLVSALWDKFMLPDWRLNAAKPAIHRSEEKDRALVEHLQKLSEAPRMASEQARAFNTQDADAVMFTQRVRLFKGKWRMLPPEVAPSAK